MVMLLLVRSRNDLCVQDGKLLFGGLAVKRRLKPDNQINQWSQSNRALAIRLITHLRYDDSETQNEPQMWIDFL